MSNAEKKKEGNGLIAVAIDNDKASQHALKWAIDYILTRGQTVILVHVKPRGDANNVLVMNRHQFDQPTKHLLLPFHCYCMRKHIQCHGVLLQHMDIAKALTEYVSIAGIQTLVIGASTKTGFGFLRTPDIPNIVKRGAPEFCNVYIIGQNKKSPVLSYPWLITALLAPIHFLLPQTVHSGRQSSLRSAHSLGQDVELAEFAPAAAGRVVSATTLAPPDLQQQLEEIVTRVVSTQLQSHLTAFEDQFRRHEALASVHHQAMQDVRCELCLPPLPPLDTLI